MKKITTILLSGFLIVGFSFASAATNTKTTKATSTPVAKQNAMLVATVSVYSASTTMIDDSNYSVYFQIYNRVGTQSNIRYGLELTNTYDSKIYDSQLANESLTLRDSQTIEINMAYKVPNFIPNGNYKLTIVVKNQNGLPLAYVPAGFPEKVITVNNKVSAPIISGCSLSVSSNEGKFINTQNIGTNPEEPINAVCDVKNDSNLDYSNVKIKLITHKKNSFGDIIDSKILDQNIDIKRKSVGPVNFSIPTAFMSQLYYLDLFLVDDKGDKLSSTLPIYYTVKGDSITLQNVVIKNVAVKKGDKTNIDVLWNYSGDHSPKSYTLNAISKSGSGAVCGTATKSILPADNITKSSLQITNQIECKDPTITVSALDNKGNTLDSSEAKINNAKETINIDENTSISSLLNINGVNKYYLIIFIVVLVLLGYGILMLKKEHKEIN